MCKMYILVYCIVLVTIANSVSSECNIPKILRNTWFSFENGKETLTEINANEITNRGKCVNIKEEHHVNYTMVLRYTECYYCVKMLVRTVNVLEKLETPCVSLAPGEEPTVERVCQSLNAAQQLTTLFSENAIPVNCRSSLEGVWQFAYQNRYRFTGECNNPDAQIKSCQTAGTQFLITNQKFNITYRKCEGMTESFDGVVEYSCLDTTNHEDFRNKNGKFSINVQGVCDAELMFMEIIANCPGSYHNATIFDNSTLKGHWFVDKNQFFAVANTKESRKDQKYRCFLRNRDDDLFIGASITPECNALQTVEKSPERYRLTPVKSEVVQPGCRLPQNFSGDWINTANIDADVVINETHIVETYYPDEGRFRRTIYICREQRDSRVMMARLTVDGCQKDYVCFDFVPQHHNIIRYRRGLAVIQKDFHTVCSWVQFKNQEDWRYDIFLKKNPTSVRCPIAGKFNFTQKGENLLETRILGGVTLSPRPNLYCKQMISDFSVCDYDQKQIQIKEKYCLSVDHLGRPLDIYSDPDYKMKCVGYWKENLKSYLISYDETDPLSKYRCWVYQRADTNRIIMSQALGPYCDLKQDVRSSNYTEGAAVTLDLTEYEREKDRCPMHFDDGSDPWVISDNKIKIFSFKYDFWSNGCGTLEVSLATLIMIVLAYLLSN